MTSGAGEPRSFARPQLVWAVLLLITVCSALAWTAAAATAKRESPRQTPAPPAALPGSSTTSAPAAAKPEAPPIPLDANKKHRERATASAGQQTASGDPSVRLQTGASGKAEACCAAAPRPAASARRAHRLRAEGKRPGARAGEGAPDGQAQGASEGEGEEAQGGEASTAPAASLQARKGKGRHGKGKEPKAKEPKAKEPKGKKEPKGGGRGGKETEQGAHQPVAVTTPSARATSLTPAAPASAPLAPIAPIAPVVLAPRIVGEAPSASSGSLASRNARRNKRATRGRSAQTIVARGLASPPALLTAPARVTRVKHVSSPARPAHPTQSQLVTTVTRIIAVVPALVWGVIGGLAALALALGAISRLAAVRARRLARQRQELLADVGLLQAALLPALPGRLGPVGTSAAYRPASGPGAGGDFYDVFALADGQLAVIVGDVSGHGRQALPHTTLLRFTLRAYLEAGLSPRGSLQAAAPVLERQLGSSFATVVLATYQPRERMLTYACAGHPPPVVAAGTQSIAALTACSSPPLGAGQPTGRRQTVVSMPGEALVCFYTDGVIEARVGRELFGASRLKQTLAELGPQASASAVLDRVAEQSDRRPDDMAACLLRVEGDELAPRVELEELELDRHDVERGRAERFLLAGGLDESKVGEALAAVRAAVTRHGGVVLELHLGEGQPEVALRPQNVAMLQPSARLAARAVG